MIIVCLTAFLKLDVFLQVKMQNLTSVMFCNHFIVLATCLPLLENYVIILYSVFAAAAYFKLSHIDNLMPTYVPNPSSVGCG